MIVGIAERLYERLLSGGDMTEGVRFLTIWYLVSFKCAVAKGS